MPFGLPSSTSSSRPSSRASSPTRNSARLPRPSNITVPSRTPGSTLAGSDPNDPLGDYFAGSHHSSSGAATPVYGSYTGSSGFGTANSDMWTPAPSSGAMTPGGGYFNVQPVEIILDSDHLIMRGQGGDMNPAYLSGRIELNLAESTNIKEITMSLHGKAKVQFSEPTGTGSKSHHFTHPVLSHDWSFLEGEKKHTHTLKAGYHSFPFSLMLNGNLPSSLQTYLGDATIQYKLKANVIRAGFASNFHDAKTFTLHRTFTPEALEFNQTLEIENTWPGKVMYSLTLPFKAYAAGDDIPVNVKFMPLAKGVRVTTVTSVIKEYTLVHTRHSSHSDQRVAASVKHEMRGGRAIQVSEETIRAPSHWNHSQTVTVSRENYANLSRPGSPVRNSLSLSTGTDAGSAGGPSSSTNADAGPSSEGELPDDEDVAVGDHEVDTHFSIHIPPWTTPSHSIHPVFVTHKIKWSCSISNADGHVSELRCALPIVILDNSLLEEARTAGSSTRALLFGGAAAEEAQQVDLPSYSNHVYDRVAVADSGNASGFLARSYGSSGIHSPHSITPPVSRGPSRPGSPTGNRPGEAGGGDDVPARRELASGVGSHLLQSLVALGTHSNGSSPEFTPPTSRGPSRPLSRRSSRSGRSSRVGSRASSPERGERAANGGANGGHDDAFGNGIGNNGGRPSTERRSTASTLSSLLHIPSSFKPIRPLSGPSKPILRNASHAQLSHLMPSDGGPIQRNSVSFTNLNDRRDSANGNGINPNGRVNFASGTNINGSGPSARARFQVNNNDDDDDAGEGDHDGGDGDNDDRHTDPISRVPSYAIASRGFVGGGVVPLDVGPPTYDDSERIRTSTTSSSTSGGESATLARPRSDTALVQLGAAEAAAAEARAGDEQQQEIARTPRVATAAL